MEIFQSLLKMPELRYGFQKIAALALFTAFVFSGGSAWADEDSPVLQVNVLEGGSSLDFGNLRSLGPQGEALPDSSSRRVRLRITNPGGRSFVISQILTADPVNESGTPLSSGAIRFRAAIENGAGILRTSDRALLEPGMQEIYDSADTNRDLDVSLLIVYDFLVPPGQKAGQYHASITYRLDER